MNYTHLFNFTKWNLYDDDESQRGSDHSEMSQTSNFFRSNGKIPTRINHYYSRKEWFKNGEYHRVEINHKTGFTLPALICSNGNKFWYFEGKQHRELTEVDPETGLTLPAVIWGNGNKFWWFEGNQHREITDVDPKTGLTLPAEIWSNGDKSWFFEGKRSVFVDINKQYCITM